MSEMDAVAAGEMRLERILGVALTAFRRRPFTIVGLAACPFLIGFVTAFALEVTRAVIVEPISLNAGSAPDTFRIAINILASIFSMISFGALVGASVGAVEGVPFTFLNALILGWRRFWPMIGVSLAVLLVVAFGLIVLIVPGVVFLLRYYFSAQIVIIEKINFLSAMKKSSLITVGHKWSILKVILVLLVLSFVTITANIGLLFVSTLAGGMLNSAHGGAMIGLVLSQIVIWVMNALFMLISASAYSEVRRLAGESVREDVEAAFA